MNTSGLKISIITVCYNAERTIEKAMRSLCSQTYSNIEYIIIDANSTDRTMEMVNEYSSRIDKVVSEKDGGIYDAMNKGLALVTGDIVYFLNADDSFCDDAVLADIVQAFQEDGLRTLVYGKVKLEDVPDYCKPFLKESFVIKSPNDFLFYTICHQAIFAKKIIFDQIGYFNCRYKYSADYDWQIRAYKFNSRGFHFLNRNICNYYYMGRNYQHEQITNNEKSVIQLHRLFSIECIWHHFRYVLIRGFKKKLLNERYKK